MNTIFKVAKIGKVKEKITHCLPSHTIFLFAPFSSRFCIIRIIYINKKTCVENI